MKITPDTFPTGTRVVSALNSKRAGIVLGWVGDSITVRWDGGGRASKPATIAGLRHEPTEAGA